MTSTALEKYIFVDRDGTLNEDKGYITNPSDISLFSGVSEALSDLKRLGFKIVVVTNQSAIGRGMASEETIHQVNSFFLNEVEKEVGKRVQGGKAPVIDAIVFCPHKPEDGCQCRKPKTALISSFYINLEDSWVIGDKISDIELGLNIGLKPQNTILVLTGHGQEEAKKMKAELKASIHICADISAAANIIKKS